VPIIGNLTGDGSPEIVVGVHAYAATPQYTRFFALSALGAILPGWPVVVGGGSGGRVIETGVLGDLNRDGHDEFIVTASRVASTPSRLYVFDGSGQVISGFPKDLPGVADPSSGDTVSYPTLAVSTMTVFWILSRFRTLTSTREAKT
jgi:hypothetical protein